MSAIARHIFLFFNVALRFIDVWSQPSDMFASSLIDAYWYFSNATAVDSHCATALTNLGIVEIKKGMYDEGIAHLQEVRCPAGSLWQ
jgi:hypothetical protein